MSSQDDYLDELLKEMPLEEDEDGTDDGQTANRPDVEAVSEMTEDEIARLLDQGKAEGRQGQEKTRALGGDASAAQDVMGMLDKTEDRELVYRYRKSIGSICILFLMIIKRFPPVRLGYEK